MYTVRASVFPPRLWVDEKANAVLKDFESPHWQRQNVVDNLGHLDSHCLHHCIIEQRVEPGIGLGEHDQCLLEHQVVHRAKSAISRVELACVELVQVEVHPDFVSPESVVNSHVGMHVWHHEGQTELVATIKILPHDVQIANDFPVGHNLPL